MCFKNVLINRVMPITAAFILVFCYVQGARADLTGNELVDRCRKLDHYLALVRYDLTVKPNSIRLLDEYKRYNKEFQQLMCPITATTRNSLKYYNDR